MNQATGHPSTEIGATYRMGFTVGEHSAGHMRRILLWFLVRWGLAETADTAGLALTELVANVVRHVPGRGCSVLIQRRPHGLRVEVSDGCPALPRLAPGCDPLSEGGRGLLLVQAVTDRWGVLSRPDGKTVWFECDG
ncbi:ATP-binding protein [Streptomyces sp. NPDC002033]|uniref:ATP-binding protein n=1 Tax=unclassified Streptomyces TaxID=2593676 RepID=UPI0033203B7D